MRAGPFTTSSILDEAVDVVRRLPGSAVAIPILCSLPLRFLQIAFVRELFMLKGEAAHYRTSLTILASWIIAALLLSSWGRVVFARACRIGDGARLRDSMRVPLAALLDFVIISLLMEILIWIASFTIVAPVLATIVTGVAIGAIEQFRRPGVIEPLRVVSRHLRHTRVLIGIFLTMLTGAIVALANLYFAFRLLLMIAGAFSLLDLQVWSGLLSPANGHFVSLVGAGAILAAEPFWICANVVFVRRAGSAQSGEDLTLWFQQLREQNS